jgi:hypothetical protein
MHLLHLTLLLLLLLLSLMTEVLQHQTSQICL